MREDDLHHLAREGVLLRNEAVAAGMTDDQLAMLTRRGHLVHLRYGQYAVGSAWRGTDPRGQHLLRCAALLRQYPGPVGLSHTSATVARSAPDYGLALDDVHLLKLDGRGGRRAGVAHHTGVCRVTDVTKHDGRWLTDGARTVLDIAGDAGYVPGLVQADWYLHHGLTTREHLSATYAARERWPQSLPGRLLIAEADGRSESVAETLARVAFKQAGIPHPEPQWTVRSHSGIHLGRVDFAWPQLKVFGEIDGKVKYTTLLRPDQTAADVLLREKRRERSIMEATGWRVLRLEWADLFRPAVVAQRFWALVGQAA